MEFEELTMIPITKDEIKKDKTLSWCIKYDLLKQSTISKVINISPMEMYNGKSETIQFMRKYNRTHEKIGQFIFMLGEPIVFYTIPNNNIPNNTDIYNEQNLQYSYDNRYK